MVTVLDVLREKEEAAAKEPRRKEEEEEEEEEQELGSSLLSELRVAIGRERCCRGVEMLEQKEVGLEHAASNEECIEFPKKFIVFEEFGKFVKSTSIRERG